MSIKSVVSISDRMTKAGLFGVFDEELREAYSGFSSEVDENFEVAKKTILSRLEEPEFCKYLAMICEHSVSRITASGDSSLVMVLQSGVLRDYTDTVVLAVIGGLIQDEIL